MLCDMPVFIHYILIAFYLAGKPVNQGKREKNFFLMDISAKKLLTWYSGKGYVSGRRKCKNLRVGTRRFLIV